MANVGIMSRFQRVQQWLVFAKQWHLIDANWQDADKLAAKVARCLTGAYKPIFHPETDCGDHVIVYNCRHVALKGFDWKRRGYYFDRLYPKAKAKIPAWELHQVDPCRIVFMEIYRSLPKNNWRRLYIERLHVLPDGNIPEELLKNVGNQIPQVQKVPKRLDQYTEEEKKKFPSLFEWPSDTAIDESDKGSSTNYVSS